MPVYTDKGLFRANPNADVDNTLRLVHPTTPGTSAKDESTALDTITGAPVAFTGIEYKAADGVTRDYVFSTAILVTDYDGLRDAIFAEISKHEVDAIITVSFSTPNVTLTHYGSGTLTEAYIDGASVDTLART